jgi:GNAT superfamily N-acetyltransferase
MSLLQLSNRFVAYYSTHGILATVKRMKLALKRGVFANRMVVFYCDLRKPLGPMTNLPTSITVERLYSYGQLPAEDLQFLTSFWNPKQAHQNIQERFEKGASLWLIRWQGNLAGYGWTVLGKTITPYFLPVGENDVQLFDFYAFPKFRGRGIHLLLIAYILQTMAAEGRTRAFGDTAEWNDAQLASFRMTPFRPLGLARSFAIRGHTFVTWDQHNAETTQQRIGTGNRETSNATGSPVP